MLDRFGVDFGAVWGWFRHDLGMYLAGFGDVLAVKNALLKLLQNIDVSKISSLGTSRKDEVQELVTGQKRNNSKRSISGPASPAQQPASGTSPVVFLRILCKDRWTPLSDEGFCTDVQRHQAWYDQDFLHFDHTDFSWKFGALYSESEGNPKSWTHEACAWAKMATDA